MIYDSRSFALLRGEVRKNPKPPLRRPPNYNSDLVGLPPIGEAVPGDNQPGNRQNRKRGYYFKHFRLERRLLNILSTYNFNFQCTSRRNISIAREIYYRILPRLWECLTLPFDRGRILDISSFYFDSLNIMNHYKGKVGGSIRGITYRW